jgi:hypothetical protein
MRPHVAAIFTPDRHGRLVAMNELGGKRAPRPFFKILDYTFLMDASRGSSRVTSSADLRRMSGSSATNAE